MHGPAPSLTRRRLLTIGAFGLLAGRSGGWLAAGEGSGRKTRRPLGDLSAPVGRPEPSRYLRYEAGRPGLHPRRVQAGRHAACRALPICELLPRMAQVMDRVTLVRSLRHEMKNHNSAGYYSLTGYAPPTDDQRLRDSRDLFPAYGSVVDRLAPARNGVPTFVAFPYVDRRRLDHARPARQLSGQGPRSAADHRQDPNAATSACPS